MTPALTSEFAVSPLYKGEYRNAPTDMIMSDGCGLANANFFKTLQDQFKWDTYPTAVQMRINGAKVSHQANGKSNILI